MTAPALTVDAPLEAVKAVARDVYEIARDRDARAARVQLQAAASQLTRATRIAVAGERSRGKSTLINGLLGRRLLPVDVDVTTNVHLEVVPARGAPEGAIVHFRDAPARAVGLEEIAAHATEAGNPGNQLGVSHVTVVVDHALVDAGMCLLDTPGVGGLAGAHGAATAHAVGQADALLMVLDARAPATDAELAFLKEAGRPDRVVVAQTWADRARDPEAILAEDRSALDRTAPALAGAPMVAVSAALALQAVDEPDPDEASLLAKEGNLEALVDALGRVALEPTIATRVRALAVQVSLVVDELERPDRAVLDATGPGGDPAQALPRARQALEHLRSRPAKRELERLLHGIMRDVDGRLRLAIADLRDELQDEMETASKLPDAEALAERWDAGVQRAWNDLCAAMDDRAQHALEDVCADLMLDPVAVEPAEPDGSELPAFAAARDGQARPQDRDKWIRRAVRGGTPAVMGLITMNPAYLLMGIGMMAGNETLQVRAVKQRELLQLLDRSARRAVPQLSSLALARFEQLQRSLLARLEPMYHARVESLAGAVDALSRPGGDPEELRSRLAELEAVRERLRVLGA